MKYDRVSISAYLNYEPVEIEESLTLDRILALATRPRWGRRGGSLSVFRSSCQREIILTAPVNPAFAREGSNRSGRILKIDADHIWPFGLGVRRLHTAHVSLGWSDRSTDDPDSTRTPLLLRDRVAFERLRETRPCRRDSAAAFS